MCDIGLLRVYFIFSTDNNLVKMQILTVEYFRRAYSIISLFRDNQSLRFSCVNFGWRIFYFKGEILYAKKTDCFITCTCYDFIFFGV